MNNQHLHYLHAMGIPVWQLRDALQTPEPVTETSGLTLLKKQVENCTACPLHRTRKQTVFGVGNSNAKIMIVGEAPGAQEDEQGEPFVGRAGLLLNEMLEATGMQRHDIYIANILKCRPPNNRNPKSDEINQCTPYLQQQINLIKPDIMMAVGRVAAHHLLTTEESFVRLRGKVHHFGEKKTPLIVTYHPAYLLRTPKDKRKAFEDLLFLQSRINSE